MACCGRRRSGRSGGNPGHGRVSIPPEMGASVVLVYQGSKRGTMQRRGPISKQWYSFSAVNPRFACARADAEYLMRSGDLALEQQAAPPPAAPPAAPPVRAAPTPAPLVRVDQPTVRKPVSLEEEAPADDLSEIKGITRDTAGILGLVSIRTFGDLASLNEDGVQRVAQLTGKGGGDVRRWIKAARKRIELEEKGDDISGPDSGNFDNVVASLPDNL